MARPWTATERMVADRTGIRPDEKAETTQGRMIQQLTAEVDRLIAALAEERDAHRYTSATVLGLAKNLAEADDALMWLYEERNHVRESDKVAYRAASARKEAKG